MIYKSPDVAIREILRSLVHALMSWVCLHTINIKYKIARAQNVKPALLSPLDNQLPTLTTTGSLSTTEAQIPHMLSRTTEKASAGITRFR